MEYFANQIVNLISAKDRFNKPIKEHITFCSFVFGLFQIYQESTKSLSEMPDSSVFARVFFLCLMVLLIFLVSFFIGKLFLYTLCSLIRIFVEVFYLKDKELNK